MQHLSFASVKLWFLNLQLRGCSKTHLHAHILSQTRTDTCMHTLTHTSQVDRMVARLSSQSVQARALGDIDEELETLEVQKENKERDRELSLRKQSKLKEDVSGNDVY